jgi:NADP-dependent 3-hydroxy acid dehydrogenase YdfG
VLTDKIALVTGASRGIGLAIAEQLLREGAHVIRVARNLSPLETESQTDVPCDITQSDAVRRTVARIVVAPGVPDIVVNNAGTFLLKPVVETTPEEFARQLSVNLGGPFLVLRELLPHLIRKRHAHLVTIGSVADHVPYAGNAAYGASKYGLRGLHEVLRRELVGTDVRTTLISPGPTNTELWDEVQPNDPNEVPDRSQMLAAEDVAQAVLFAVTRPERVNVELIRLGPAA